MKFFLPTIFLSVMAVSADSSSSSSSSSQTSSGDDSSIENNRDDPGVGNNRDICPPGQYDFMVRWSPGSDPYANNWSLTKGDTEIATRSFMGCPSDQVCETHICLRTCHTYRLYVRNLDGNGFYDGGSFYADAIDEFGDNHVFLQLNAHEDWASGGDEEFELVRFGCSSEDLSVDGRPLIDGSGIQRQAEAIEVDGKKIVQKWSEKKMVDDLLPATKNSTQFQKLSQEWTHRALGEHASIGSFAIFSMALLTNQAPPDLIQASLTAAEDELRHAKVSFEVASLLRGVNGGLPLEPSPYEPASYEFSHDMTALAVGAAEEGCVDETISALVAAAQADYYGSQPDLGEFSRVLQGATDTIAMEEGRHSILAWRTVHWACQKDIAACKAAKEILGSSKFPSSRFSDLGVDVEELEKVWNNMHQTLESLVTSGVNNVSLADTNGCSHSYESIWKDNLGSKSKLEILANNIVHGVYCSIFPELEEEVVLQR